ncbi:MAG TPA: DUF6504 family protein [Candidatus Tumulicola sp.]|nr:DUF6504 family protein [Candidatus Tumulicola sp.]
MRRFVSQAIEPLGDGLFTAAIGTEPPVPKTFVWGDRKLVVTAVLKKWRSTKDDRGDTYLKRHWFALQTACGLTIEVYYDRQARRTAPRWWLYSVVDESRSG